MEIVHQAALALVCATALGACSHASQARPKLATQATAEHPVRERTLGEARRDGRGEPAADVAVQGWPSGWMVAEDDTWIPVVDAMGRDLEHARTALRGDHADQAAADVHRAANRLAEANVENEATPRAEETVRQLRALGDRLERGEPTTIAQFDRVATAAYAADLEGGWIDVRDEDVAVILNRPDEHIDAARRSLKDEAGEAAEHQIRQAVALYRVELRRVATRGDTALLRQRIDALEHYASRARRGQATLTGLNEHIASVEATFAEHYAHRARMDYDEARERDAGHAMRALAVHLRRETAAAEPETPHAEDSLATTLETNGRALAEGQTASSVIATLDRAQARASELVN
ncbi:MAG: hypothetical protein KC619_21950 [Myxococcales bacterium]|nr:hypothetical protein [Myxococcales bacterium]